MKAIFLLVWAVLALAPHAHANPIYASTGSVSIRTCPVSPGTCAGLHAVGSISTLDGTAYSQNYALCDLFTLGAAGYMPCTTTGHLYIQYAGGGGLAFDDEAAQITLYGAGSCPDSASVTGTELGMDYAAHFTNRHVGDDGYQAFDYLLIRPCCPVPPGGGSSIDGTDPFKRPR